MNYGDISSTVGDALAALAIVVAAVQLRAAAESARQTRLDLREDRRLDFYVGQLVDVALASEKGPSVGFSSLQIQIGLRMLPSDLLPLLRAQYQIEPSAQGQQRLAELQAARPIPSGMSFLEHFQPEIRDEIAEARDHLLQLRPQVRQRPPRWKLWQV